MNARHAQTQLSAMYICRLYHYNLIKIVLTVSHLYIILVYFKLHVCAGIANIDCCLMVVNRRNITKNLIKVFFFLGI